MARFHAAALVLSVLAWALPALGEGEEESVKSFRKLRRQLPDGGPEYVFELYAEETRANFAYRLEIGPTARPWVRQVERFRHGISLEAEPEALGLSAGKPLEVRVLGGRSAGEPWYKVWRLDPSSGRFVWAPPPDLGLRLPLELLALPAPAEIERVEVSSPTSGEPLDEAGVKQLLANARAIDPSDPSIAAWSYAPWLQGRFRSRAGWFRFHAYLGWRLRVVDPQGRVGMFDAVGPDVTSPASRTPR